jgi:solute carrier family 25 phosphate transporter 23/24/25/41
MGSLSYDALEPAWLRRQRIRRLFDSIDTDKSGVLDAEEIRKKMLSFSKSGVSGTESAELYAKGLMERADSSGDGLIDAEEFEAFVVQQERDLYRLFAEMDTSGDGVVELAELRAALESRGINATEKSLKKFVANINVDGDQTVSWIEFRDAFALNPASVDLVSAFSFYQDMFGASVTGTEFIALPPDDAKAKGTRMRYILASMISAAASRTCTAPMERIRIYLTLGGGEKRKPKWYSMLTRAGRNDLIANARATIQTIMKDGGLIRGFWRGNLISIVKIIPEASARSLALGQTRVLVARMERVEDGISISPSGRFAAGAMGGLMSTAVVYPLDILRIRMMANVGRDAVEAGPAVSGSPAVNVDGTRRYHTIDRAGQRRLGNRVPLHADSTSSINETRSLTKWMRFNRDFLQDHPALETARSMFVEGGWRAFYKGFGLALVGIVPYAGINLSVFETLKNGYLNSEGSGDRPHLLAILGIGCLAGATAETAVYPLTVLRARMQSMKTVTNPEFYANSADCVRQLWRSNGIKGFYRGLVPTLAKAAPGVGIGFTLFEVSKDLLKIG